MVVVQYSVVQRCICTDYTWAAPIACEPPAKSDNRHLSNCARLSLAQRETCSFITRTIVKIPRSMVNEVTTKEGSARKRRDQSCSPWIFMHIDKSVLPTSSFLTHGLRTQVIRQP